MQDPLDGIRRKEVSYEFDLYIRVIGNSRLFLSILNNRIPIERYDSLQSGLYEVRFVISNHKYIIFPDFEMTTGVKS